MGRSSGFNGPDPITPQDILAYQQLHGVTFTPWELEMIDAFDAIAIEAMHMKKD